MSNASGRPLLVSFHRPLARHQILGVARSVCDKGMYATEEDIDYRFMYKLFDPEDIEGSADELVAQLDADHPGWTNRPMYYETSGLVAASNALCQKLLDRHPEAQSIRLAPYANEYGQSEPTIYVLANIGKSAVDPKTYLDDLPRQVVLLNMGESPLPEEDLRHIAAQAEVTRWYPGGLRELHAGVWPENDHGFRAGDLFEGFTANPHVFYGKLEQWLKHHPATRSITWSHVPLVLSWFEATSDQMAAAISFLHGQSGGFPHFVFYSLDDPKRTQRTHRNYTAHIVSAREMRQQYHPTPADDGPQSTPDDVEERVDGLTACAAAWLIHRWPRHFRHVLEHKGQLRSASVLKLPLTPQERLLGDVLSPSIYRSHSLMCTLADNATAEPDVWEALVLSNWTFAYRIASALRPDPRWCVSLSDALQQAADTATSNECGVCAVEGFAHTVVLDTRVLASVVGDMAGTATDRAVPGRQPALVLQADVRGGKTLVLSIAHNGAPPDQAAVDRIRNSPGEGTKTLLEFAADHLATLGLIWQDDSGRHYMQRFGGEWVSGDQGIRACRGPAASWGEPQQWEDDGDPWPVPEGYTTVWQFLIPLDIFRVEDNMPLRPGDLSS